MLIVQIYRGWRIRRHTRREQTLDERDQSITWYTVLPVEPTPNRTYSSPRFNTPGEAMRWIDRQAPEPN